VRRSIKKLRTCPRPDLIRRQGFLGSSISAGPAACPNHPGQDMKDRRAGSCPCSAASCLSRGIFRSGDFRAGLWSGVTIGGCCGMATMLPRPPHECGHNVASPTKWAHDFDRSPAHHRRTASRPRPAGFLRSGFFLRPLPICEFNSHVNSCPITHARSPPAGLFLAGSPPGSRRKNDLHLCLGDRARTSGEH
jgi:hypothetical protein